MAAPMILGANGKPMPGLEPMLPTLDPVRVRPMHGEVMLRPREDLDPTSPGFALPRDYRLTACNDNVGVVEVVSIGPPPVDAHENDLRPEVRPGDIMLVAFGEVRQGVVIDTKSLYIANEGCLLGRLHPDGRVEPFWDYVVTKSAPERMARAVWGPDTRHVVPPSIVRQGLPSGEVMTRRCSFCGQIDQYCEDKPSEPVAFVVYEECVSAGPGVSVRGKLRANPWKPGELLLFATSFAAEFRVNGEWLRAVRAAHVLCAVDV